MGSGARTDLEPTANLREVSQLEAAAKLSSWLIWVPVGIGITPQICGIRLHAPKLSGWRILIMAVTGYQTKLQICSLITLHAPKQRQRESLSNNDNNLEPAPKQNQPSVLSNNDNTVDPTPKHNTRNEASFVKK